MDNVSFLLEYGIKAKNLGAISLYLRVAHPERYPEYNIEADLER